MAEGDPNARGAGGAALSPARTWDAAASGDASVRQIVQGDAALARDAQREWALVPLRERLRVLRAFRHELATRAEELARAADASHARSPGETLAAEVIPLADACRFLERNAARILAPRDLGTRIAHLFLAGVHVEVRREPVGVVLVVGPSNYALFLPGVQALQALAAGNAVLVKPGRGCGRACQALTALFEAGGLDGRLCRVLPEAPEAALTAVRAGVDKVALTGSARTGRALLAELAPRLTPAVLELSGCDAVFLLEDADLDVVARALAFGLRLNAGATCIAPRRVFVPEALAADLETRLALVLARAPACRVLSDRAVFAHRLIQDAIRRGARLVVGVPDETEFHPVVLSDASPDMALLQEDVSAPVLGIVKVQDTDEALALAARCPYALGAAVFGAPERARELAERISAGAVVVNDIIVPTADARLPFGGRAQSGYGVTRGAEGLLEMTTIKAVATRRWGWRPHMRAGTLDMQALLSAYVRAAHGATLGGRLRALFALVRTLARGAAPAQGKGDPLHR